MAHHGSKKYQHGWIHYRPQDLKVIERIWRECLGENFRPDPHRGLRELVDDQLSVGTYEMIRDLIRNAGFAGRQPHFVDSSNHATLIPRDLTPLVDLALAKTADEEGFAYSIESENVYVGRRNILRKYGLTPAQPLIASSD